MQTSEIKAGMILENIANGKTLATVRVMGELTVGGETWFRICDRRETATDKQLIARNRTWAVPAANLSPKSEPVEHELDGGSSGVCIPECSCKLQGVK